MFAKLSDSDIAAFFDRQKMFGEVEAVRWAQNKQGAPSPAAQPSP